VVGNCAVGNQPNYDWQGSIVLTAESPGPGQPSQPIVAIVNQNQTETGDSRHQSYSGSPAGGGTILYSPFAANYWVYRRGTTDYTYVSASYAQNVNGIPVFASSENNYFYADGQDRENGSRPICHDPDTGQERLCGSRKALAAYQACMFYAPAEDGRLPSAYKFSVRPWGEGNSIVGVTNYTRAINGIYSYDFGASFNMPPH
jgi:hypothetical protein